MNKIDFLKALDDMLELDSGTLTGNEVLKELEMWDSLAVISFIALVDEKLGFVVEGQKLAMAKTIDDLISLVKDKLDA
ncbi:Carrier domain-containing protein [Azospirillaceae bacterium]